MFELKKISNYGTSHPVVARLSIQSHELLQWAAISQEKRDEVYGALREVQRRIVNCEEIFCRLKQAYNKAIEDTPPSTGDPRVINVPSLIGIEKECETFLHEARSIFRDLLILPNAFFDKKFSEPSAFCDFKQKGLSEISKWARTQFGEKDAFTLMLISEQEWIGDLIQKRNAMIHPGGHSGTLIINDFSYMDEKNFLNPNWRTNVGTPTDILLDIEACLKNFLELAEDMLVFCIERKNNHSNMIVFYEISEEERDEKCPVRIRAGLSEEMRSKFTRASSK